jgi:hypothetical protein
MDLSQPSETPLLKSIYYFKILDIPYAAFTILGKYRLDPGSNLDLGFVLNAYVVLKQGIGAVEFNKSVAVGDWLLSARFRIDESKTEDSKGTDDALRADFHPVFHFDKAISAHTARRDINFLALGAFDRHESAVIPQLRKKLAAVHAHGISERLYRVA